MTTVQQAESIILSYAINYGIENIPFTDAAGRYLAVDIVADRDLPACNRVTMDGIAISYNAYCNGVRTYAIKATMAAGDESVQISAPTECIEIMTGAQLPDSTDTIVRYEDVAISNGMATIAKDAVVKEGQNIHRKGKDKKQGDIVAAAGQYVSPALISIAASVGCSMPGVKKLPRVVIISTGGELVDVHQTPTAAQVRRSNGYTVRANLQQYGIQADMLHIPDDETVIKAEIERCLATYDVLLLSGGVSMGRYDYVPAALAAQQVSCLFHKVQQRPGKPLWFGIRGSKLVFAFPGNPVSTFLCLHRYFIPWLQKCQSSGVLPEDAEAPDGVYAVLACDVHFTAPLQYFMQVKLAITRQGTLLATPVEGNGSGDYANLLASDAFMELPMEDNIFAAGNVYRIWPFKPII